MGMVSATAVLGLVACSSGNAAFDDSRDGPSSSDDPVLTSSTGNDAPATTDVEASSGEAMTCEGHPNRRIELMVTVDGGPPPPPDCASGDALLFPLGPNLTLPNGAVEHTSCGSCNCDGARPELILEFGETLMPPPGIDCSEVLVFPQQTINGCIWGGFALMPHPEEGPPYFIASNARSVDVFGVGLGLTSDGVCPGFDPCPTGIPGRHALVAGSQTVTADGPPTDVILNIDSTPVAYMLNNRMSSITAQCQERMAWTALRPSG